MSCLADYRRSDFAYRFLRRLDGDDAISPKIVQSATDSHDQLGAARTS